MKKKSVILTILVLIYFCITYVYSTNIFDKDGRYSISDDLKNKMIGADKTVYMNEEILTQEFDMNEYNNNNIYLNYMYMSYDGVETYYYFADASKVDELIKKYNLKNSRNIDFSKRNHEIPFEDERYKNLFASYTKEKKQANIIGTDKNGKSIYDISPDTIILGVHNNDIKSFAYIDNRLIDTRQIINADKPYIYYPSEISIKYSDKEDGTYNKYKMVVNEQEEEEKQDD
jgi:hypothetical protein